MPKVAIYMKVRVEARSASLDGVYYTFRDLLEAIKDFLWQQFGWSES